MASQTQIFVVVVLSALLGAAYVPRIGAQAILDLSAAYNLAGGFFVYNLQEGSCLGADGNWFLTQGSYGFASSNSPYYLFTLTYNRNIGGTPPSFNSSQWFEIMMPSTKSATYLQWNVWDWSNPVDMYSVGTQAFSNVLFSFQLLDPFNKFYAIVSRLNNFCVTAVGGGGGWQIQPCQVTNTAQFFQFIDPNGYPAQLTQTMAAVNLSTAYSLPNYFMFYNVYDSSALGKEISPRSNNLLFQETTNLTAAALDPDFYFNLSYNRGSGVPSFTSSSVFEINLPATQVATYLQWNIWNWKEEVALWQVEATSARNAVFSFSLVDAMNNLYVIMSPLYNDGYCVTSVGNYFMWLMPCRGGNTTQLFQFINPNNQVSALPPPTTATTTTIPSTIPTTSTPTTTTSTVVPTIGVQGWVEITCFANSSFTAMSSWQSQAVVESSIIAALTTVLSSASFKSVVAVTAFNVQSGTQNNGQQGNTVRVVVQTSTSQQALLLLQGVGNSLLNSLLVSAGVGQLIAVQPASSSSGDIPATPAPNTSTSNGFFSEGWQVAVFIIVILVAVFIFVAYFAWRFQQRRKETLVSGRAASAALPGLKLEDMERNDALERGAPEGEKNVRRNSASLQLGQMHPFAGKSDDTQIETGDTSDDAVSTRLHTVSDDSASPAITDV